MDEFFHSIIADLESDDEGQRLQGVERAGYMARAFARVLRTAAGDESINVRLSANGWLDQIATGVYEEADDAHATD